MLSVKEMAKRLGVAKMTVYRLIHADKIEAIRVGKSYRVTEAAFKAYMKEARTGGKASGGAAGQASRGLSEG